MAALLRAHAEADAARITRPGPVPEAPPSDHAADAEGPLPEFPEAAITLSSDLDSTVARAAVRVPKVEVLGSDSALAASVLAALTAGRGFAPSARGVRPDSSAAAAPTVAPRRDPERAPQAASRGAHVPAPPAPSSTSTQRDAAPSTPLSATAERTQAPWVVYGDAGNVLFRSRCVGPECSLEEVAAALGSELARDETGSLKHRLLDSVSESLVSARRCAVHRLLRECAVRRGGGEREAVVNV